MLIPSQQRVEVHAHTQRHLLDIIQNPLLFQQHCPHTTICYLTPQMLPNFNDEAIYDNSKAKVIQALITFLTDLNSPSFTSTTSDDFAIIITCGCTIAMTLDSLSCIDGTYQT